MAELSHHPEKVNIHGKVGCTTSSGGVCTACCFALKVEEVDKPANIACKHQEFCTGCRIHNTREQPDVCRDYHCSLPLEVLDNPLITDPILRSWAESVVSNLLKVARQNGEITQEELVSRMNAFKLKL